MIVMVVIRKLKSLLLFFLNCVKRCFCCFKGKLGNDGSLPMTVDGGNYKEGEKNSLEQWENWDNLSSVVSDGNKTSSGRGISQVEMQIQEYRMSQQRKLTQPPDEPPEEPDYFENLAPKFPKKSKVVILARPEEEQQVSNRISLSLDPALQGGDLKEWEENDDGGWEDEAEQEMNLDEALKEQREMQRQERKMERLKRKQEKEISKSSLSKLATKLS